MDASVHRIGIAMCHTGIDRTRKSCRSLSHQRSKEASTSSPTFLNKKSFGCPYFTDLVRMYPVGEGVYACIPQKPKRSHISIRKMVVNERVWDGVVGEVSMWPPISFARHSLHIIPETWFTFLRNQSYLPLKKYLQSLAGVSTKLRPAPLLTQYLQGPE